MSIFQNPDDPAKLCKILRTFVEEWGPENLVVFVPDHWRSFTPPTLGRVKVEFVPANTVSIQVHCDDSCVSYDLDLRPGTEPYPYPSSPKSSHPINS